MSKSTLGPPPISFILQREPSSFALSSDGQGRGGGGGGGGASGCDGGLGPAPRLDPERPQHHQQGPPRRGWASYWDECAALPAIIPSDRHRTAGGRWTSNGPGHGPAKGPVHTQPIARSKVQRLARTLIHVPVST